MTAVFENRNYFSQSTPAILAALALLLALVKGDRLGGSMEAAADGDALRARRGLAAAFEADASTADRPVLAAGARRSSIDCRAAVGASSAFAYRYGRGASASASTSPNMMPAAFLHQGGRLPDA
jgi:hypothetical protein